MAQRKKIKAARLWVSLGQATMQTKRADTLIFRFWAKNQTRNMIKSWSWIGSNVTRRRMRIRLIKRQIEALRLHCSGHAQDSPLMQSPANRLAIFGPEVAVASSAQESCHRGSTEPCAECWPVLVTLHAESRRVERDLLHRERRHLNVTRPRICNNQPSRF